MWMKMKMRWRSKLSEFLPIEFVKGRKVLEIFTMATMVGFSDWLCICLEVKINRVRDRYKLKDAARG